MTDTTQVATVSTPKSVAQRAARKRFSFGPVWNAAVVAGTATDQAKLLEQAIALKVGAKSDLRKLKLITLRAKVAARLEAQATVPAVTEADAVAGELASETSQA
jgi:hypothetical protein